MKRIAELLQVDLDWFPKRENSHAEEDFLIVLAEYILKTKPTVIVEAGPGVSTLVMARAMQLNNFEAKLTTMEHVPKYNDRIVGWLQDRNLFHYVNAKCFELQGLPPFYRYNFRIGRIDMLVADGPPDSIHPMAKYGIKRLFKSLAPGASVFFNGMKSPGGKSMRDILVWELHDYKFTNVDTKAGILILTKDKGDIKKVLVSVPHMGWIHSDVVHTIYKCLEDERFDVNYELSRASPNTVNYCRIAKMVRDYGYDWWLNVDDDNPPLRNPLDLIRYGKDIITCPTMVWKETEPGEPFHWNAYQFNSEKDNYSAYPVHDGLQRVDAVGMGCTLIRGDVLRHPDMQYQPFMREFSDDGCNVIRGTDIRFCEKATDAGFEIWAHYDYLCLHHKEIELNSAVTLIGGTVEKYHADIKAEAERQHE